eukprot:681843-Amorphochlora_amoeboformis.AAC.2
MGELIARNSSLRKRNLVESQCNVSRLGLCTIAFLYFSKYPYTLAGSYHQLESPHKTLNLEKKFYTAQLDFPPIPPAPRAQISSAIRPPPTSTAHQPHRSDGYNT